MLQLKEIGRTVSILPFFSYLLIMNNLLITRLDENILGLTGLSDVADILGDLVKEGALSPSALHRSPLVTMMTRYDPILMDVTTLKTNIANKCINQYIKHISKCVRSVFLFLFFSVRSSKPEERQRRAMMEEERKELRTWMRRKQRERLVEYHKQREERRERERVPFTSSNPLVRLGLSAFPSLS